MLSRIISVALLAAVGYWYWTGPYQDSVNPSYDQKLKQNAENMRLCVRTKNYKAGATGVGEGNPEELCARKYNFYQYNGQWHSYDDVRQDR